MASVGQLFEVAAAAVDERDGVFTAAKGTATELEVIARLLRLGHKVATPVVDDDGVDLIVDYRTLVQVKYTGLKHPKTGAGIFCPIRTVRAREGDARRRVSIAAHVDVVVVEVAAVGFFVVPRDVIGDRRNVYFGPGMEQWREAWSVFDAA